MAYSGSNHVDLEQGRPQGVQAPSENDREETGEVSSQVNPEQEARRLEEIAMAVSGSNHVDLEQERPQGVQAPSENEREETGGGSSQVNPEQGSGPVSAAALLEKIEKRTKSGTEPNSRRPSIWRVPPRLRNEDANAYEPQVVYIGPLHQGKTKLLPMEEFKFDILCKLVKDRRRDILDDIFREVSYCLPKVKEEYSEKIELPNQEFTEMLVIDGCFILAFCCLPEKEFYHLGGSYQNIGKDLALLENQIPFFVVNKLYQKIADMYPDVKNEFPDLTRLFLYIFDISLPPEKYPKEEQIRHLLHLIHLSQDPTLVSDAPVQRSCLQQATTLMKKVMEMIFALFLWMVYIFLFPGRALSGGSKQQRSSADLLTIPSATELREAGIKFKKKARPKKHYAPDRLKVSFRDGTLEIPGFSVYDTTCSELRNLIAFEQRELYFTPPHVTHYCFLLDGLINTADDVGILRRSGILENMMGSDSEVAEMFNGLCKTVVINSEKNYYSEKDLFKDVMEYVEAPHHKWRADLVHTYFHNPWSILSLMAALVLVVFTVTQTMFTIYPRKQY